MASPRGGRANPASPRLQRRVLALYVINKSGGLIYQKDFADIPRRRGNDYLRIASTFHGLHVMASSWAPPEGDDLRLQNGGIESLEAGSFSLHCLTTLTGVKFFLVAEPGARAADLSRALHAVYVSYVDYVLKNPFYVTEMPIHCALFDKDLERQFA